jgi:hypothetical protein
LAAAGVAGCQGVLDEPAGVLERGHLSVDPRPDLTVALRDLGAGRTEAAETLLPVLVGELRAIAQGYLASRSASHTLQPTALVNEAYLKLVDARQSEPLQTQARMRQSHGDDRDRPKPVERGDAAHIRMMSTRNEAGQGESTTVHKHCDVTPDSNTVRG